MTSIDIGTIGKSESAALAILNRELTDDDKKAVRIALFTLLKDRYAEMPNAFTPSSKVIKAPYQVKLLPLIKKLRESCIPPGVVYTLQEEDTGHRSRQRRLPTWASPRVS